MNIDDAKAKILDLLRVQGQAKNSDMLAAVGGHRALIEQVREDLIFNDLAEDKKGVGLVYIGTEDSEHHDEITPSAKEQQKPAKKAKVFLSYGRRDAKELADRLSVDLAAAGYEVWQDTRQIRAGRQWQQEIEDGLRSTQLVVALLSPHAVRQRSNPDIPNNMDSVCLDEIRFARFARPPKPIVPAMAQPCEPPFCIDRLDYVDLTA